MDRIDDTSKRIAFGDVESGKVVINSVREFANHVKVIECSITTMFMKMI